MTTLRDRARVQSRRYAAANMRRHGKRGWIERREEQARRAERAYSEMGAAEQHHTDGENCGNDRQNRHRMSALAGLDRREPSA